MPRITPRRASLRRLTAMPVKVQRRRRKVRLNRNAMIHQDILKGEYLS